MTQERKKLGKWGEDKAIEYLTAKGYRILDRNVHTRLGEIDIVAETRDGRSRWTVFVEVKTRTSQTYGYPEEAVDHRKREHILRAAAIYLQEHPQRSEHWQVDVIAVEKFSDQEDPEIHHFSDVFS